MSDVQSVIAQVSPPSRGDLGQVMTGYYVRSGKLITMTDGDGVPVRNPLSGLPITHKMQEGDEERQVAGRLTVKVYRMVRGGDRNDFFYPLIYPKYEVA